MRRHLKNARLRCIAFTLERMVTTSFSFKSIFSEYLKRNGIAKCFKIALVNMKTLTQGVYYNLLVVFVQIEFRVRDRLALTDGL